MKLLFLLVIMVSSIFAFNVNSSLLKIHATLLPKIYLMDYNYKEKIKNNSITIALVYKPYDYQVAKQLEELLEKKYVQGIKGYELEVKLVAYSDVKSAQANIYYLFPSSSEDIKQVVKHADRQSALTFSYKRDDLRHGVMISLVVSKKIKPLLNLSAIQMHEISFRPVLLKISSIFDKKIGLNLNGNFLEYFDMLKYYRV